MNNQRISRFRKLLNPRDWAYGLFWSWNLIFLAFMLLGFAPQMLPEMVNAVRTGSVPVAFLAYAVILTAIPALTVILGFTLLKRSPERLFALGYGVEAPLMLLFAIRFFVVREMTAGIAMLLVTTGLGTAVFLWQILDRSIDKRGPVLTHLRLIGLTLLLITGLYASLWIAFYAVPLAAQSGEILSDMIQNIWRGLQAFKWSDLSGQWRWIPFWILGFILLIYSGTLFVLMPVAVSILYGRAWWRGVQALARSYSRPRAATVTTAVLALFLAFFIQTNRQPQHTAFALLETPPTTVAEAQTLIEQEAAIRKGLLNAYLAPQRYITSVGEVRHVSDMYEWALDMSPAEARRIQSLYEVIAQPILYMPVKEVNDDTLNNRGRTVPLRVEPQEAAELYEAFFDETIIDGEHDTVVRAVRSTWSIDQARAAWQAVDDREIHLSHQEINIKEHGDWADIELYEIYQNQTGQRQEVVYYFSLPESAVITGVWLGNSPDRNDRFTYRVSPRGAAQAMYRNEVRRRVDPALVEQIGPRQYRLRVFPIERQIMRHEDAWSASTIEQGPPLHMWLTWRVLLSEDAWPLPRLAEKRNVYWDETSVRLINGEPMAADTRDWLPASIPASSPVEAMLHRVDFPGGQSVIARPVSAAELQVASDDFKLAVVLDRSRSMIGYADDVKAALAQLAGMGTAVDAYLTASDYHGESPSLVTLDEIDPEDIVFAGGQNAAELLLQFSTLNSGQTYDAILVLTDGSGYELDDSEIKIPIPDSPVWMIHLGGAFPLGYDDATLEAIQASGGGIAGSVTEALTRMSFGLEASQDQNRVVDLIDDYVWETVPTETVEASMEDSPAAASVANDFEAIAARRLILSEMVKHRGSLSQLETLDQLHEIAIQQSIITPYSSMIVLVEQRQERLLDRLEGQGDRFEREYEDIGETDPLTVTGVPEPEEWLLLALAASMLIWYIRTTRREPGYVV